MTDGIVLVAFLVMLAWFGLAVLRMYSMSISESIFWTCGGCDKRIDCGEGEHGRYIRDELDECRHCGWERPEDGTTWTRKVGVQKASCSLQPGAKDQIDSLPVVCDVCGRHWSRKEWATRENCDCRTMNPEELRIRLDAADERFGFSVPSEGDEAIEPQAEEELWRWHSYTPFKKGAAQVPGDESIQSGDADGRIEADAPHPTTRVAGQNPYLTCGTCGASASQVVLVYRQGVMLCPKCWSKLPNVLPISDCKTKGHIWVGASQSCEAARKDVWLCRRCKGEVSCRDAVLYSYKGRVTPYSLTGVFDAQCNVAANVLSLPDIDVKIEEPDDWPCQHFHGGSVEAFRESTNGLCQHSECRPAEEGPVWNPPHITVDRANGIMRVTAVYISDEQWAWIEACIKARFALAELGHAQYVWELAEETRTVVSGEHEAVSRVYRFVVFPFEA